MLSRLPTSVGISLASNQNVICRTLALSSREASSKAAKLHREWKISIGKTDDESAHTIKLNGINIKTPLRNLLKIRDETLALAIANEWRQTSNKKKLNLTNMHLTTLAYTAIDNPFNEAEEQIVKSIMEYLNFDTIRFRDVDYEELLLRQSRHWDPMIEWFNHKFDCNLPIEYGDIIATSPLPKVTQDSVHRYLSSHSRLPLIGIRFMAENLKSYVLASSLTERFLKVEQAVDLARLETKYQVEKWSKVEWEHDVEEQSTIARVAAGNLFYHLSL